MTNPENNKEFEIFDACENSHDHGPVEIVAILLLLFWIAIGYFIFH